ncbi:EF-hand domain-containing protein [Nonomuraea ceibae]|uniref:EF-hand domain-containing protein n=1 Tax=Nonomuraea ceibae TaxID=1935170 RepID=UPI001C5F50F9|nr:EF-hand domain-containing protein [Nonomuraea ceibae]
MASTFQRGRVQLVFSAMDADGDGALRESDFDDLARRWAAIRRAGDAERLTAAMRGGRTLAAHGRNPESVTLDDVLTVVDATAEAMFDAIDEDSDGRISPGGVRPPLGRVLGRRRPCGAGHPRLRHTSRLIAA